MRLVIDNSQFRLLLGFTLFTGMAQLLFMMLQPWLALETTDSAFWVGATVGASGAGLLSFSVVGGVLADRFERRSVLVAALCVQVAASAGLAALDFTGQVRVGYIMLLGFVDAAMLAVLVPSAMTLVLDVVGKEKLLPALYIDQMVMGSAGIIAPLSAGRIVDSFDIAWAYVFVAACQAAAVPLALRLRRQAKRETGDESPLTELKEGVKYVVGAPVVRALFIGILLIEYFGFMHEPMVPIMARDVLEVGAGGLGNIIAAGSAGGLVAALMLSHYGEIERKGRLLILGAVAFGVFMIAFAFSRNVALSLALYGFMYAGIVIYDTSVWTLLQTVVPDHIRGRVLGFRSMTGGTVWLLGFQTGAIAEVIGAPATMVLGGGVVVGMAAVLYRSVAGIRGRLPAEAASRVPNVD